MRENPDGRRVSSFCRNFAAERKSTSAAARLPILKTMMTKLFFLLSLLAYLCVPAGAAHDTHSCRTDSIIPEDSVLADSTDTDTLTTESLPERIRHLLQNDIFDRTQVGLYVYDLTADTLVMAYHERQCMRPASNMKLVTAITALQTLGSDYEYHTRLFATELGRDSVWNGRLYVKGGYDPLIDREDLRAMADSLLAHGIRHISGPVLLDLSFKDSKRWGWGWCWDDDEVPLIPLLYDNRDSFATNLQHILHEAGIDWDGSTMEGTVPDNARLLCVRSHNIDQALLPMMKQSDNSIAESLFYQLAASGGYNRAGRKQAVAKVNALISRLGLNPSHYQIADGSGLSLYNYLTPELLGKLLRFAYNHEAVYRHLLPTLPIAGHDGTLRRRMRGSRAADNVQAKTGTVEGVSTLSGYLTTATGNRLCFSIMNQGIRHSATGRNFQDRLCKALCR